MSDERAEIRVNWTRMLIEGYEQSLSPDLFSRAMERIDPVFLAQLDESGPFDWLDASIHLAVVEAPFGLMPKDEFRSVWRKHVLDSFERPIFRALTQGALRLFHRSPLSLARVVPNGWALVSRKCGSFRVEEELEDGSGTVTVSNLPIGYRQSEAFALAWAAALEAFITLGLGNGSVGVDLSSKDEGRLIFRYRSNTESESI